MISIPFSVAVSKLLMFTCCNCMIFYSIQCCSFKIIDVYMLQLYDFYSVQCCSFKIIDICMLQFLFHLVLLFHIKNVAMV